MFIMFKNVNIDSFKTLKNSFYLFCITIILIYLIRCYSNFIRLARAINKLPGPAIRNILIGNVDKFYVSAYTKNWLPATYKTLLDLCEDYRKDGVFRLWIGPFNPIVVMMSEDNVEAVLLSAANVEKAPEYKYLRPWLRLSTFSCTNPKWHTFRKLLTSAFHFKILENLIPTTVKQMHTMMSLIDKQIDENEGILDIRPLLTNYTLDVICETAMGVTVNAQLNRNCDYVKAIDNVWALFVARFIRPWLRSDLIFYFSSLGRFSRKNLSILHNFTHSVLKMRKLEVLDKIKELNHKNESSAEAIDSAMTGIGLKRKLVFLDFLIDIHLKNGDNMSELDVRSEVDAFMFGGFDTTASSLMFTLMLVGNDANVQNKIHEELDEIFSDDFNRQITIEDLRKIQYLDQCIKESLRLYPIGQFIGRKTGEPIKLSNGVEIPSGCTCYLPIVSLHRDPKYFPNPEVFDPNRFSPDLIGQIHPYAYVPFSGGPRSCIGQKFAGLQMKATLATIFRKYRIESLVDRNDICIENPIIMKPKTNLKMKFELRK